VARINGVNIPVAGPQNPSPSRDNTSKGETNPVRRLLQGLEKEVLSRGGQVPQKAPRQPDSEELKRILEELQRRLDLFNKQLKIEIDRELDIPVVKIVDKETNEVIRQIPPEYLLKLMKNIDQMLGLLVNERV